MIADRVFQNAKVYSVAMDGTETRAQAVAVKDGKIVYIGTDEGAKAFVGEGTVVTDCKGGSLLPGFGDAHMHFALSNRRFGIIDLNDIATDLEHQTCEDLVHIIQERVKAFAATHPDDAVLHGCGWDRLWFQGTLRGETRQLTRHDIDAVVSDRPVILDSVCGHACLLNTKALELAGVDKNTPEPTEGVIRREADGTPDGFLQEPAVIQAVCGAIANSGFSDAQNREAILRAQEHFASKGITYLSDCMEDKDAYNVMRQLAREGQLKARVDGVFLIKEGSRDEDLRHAMESRAASAVDDLFKIDTTKYFLDGNFAMVEPYEDSFCDANGLPRGTGTTEGFLWDLNNFKEALEKAQKAGFNIHIHSFGDLATRESLNAIENAQKQAPDQGLRNIIAHVFFIQDDDRKRMADLGVIASIQPQWESANEQDNKAILDIVGPERFKGLYPCASLMRDGVVCAFGSDFPVTVTDPLEGITNAMTRKFAKSSKFYSFFRDLPAVNPAECISLREAIKGWTINVAYQFHRENLTGSIELGKSAELVLLDKDIESVPPEDICLLQVKETVFKGNTTYLAK